jgi:hypothetical protein
MKFHRKFATKPQAGTIHGSLSNCRDVSDNNDIQRKMLSADMQLYAIHS